MCETRQTKALEYLDKIIHLPFCIPPMSEAKWLNLLETLLNGTDNSCLVTHQRLKKCFEVNVGRVFIQFIILL